MSDEKPPLERTSDAWIMHLRPWIKRRIERLRDELERPGGEVEMIRGSIAELRHIMREVEPELPEDGTSASYFPTAETGPS